MTSPEPPNVRPALPGFAPGVRDAIYAHVYADPANEVGGLLAGDRRSDGVMVVGAVRATGARGDVTRLTFTHDAWSVMLAELEERYPGAAIVGWYHSHPGHGIFLSRHDRFIHDHFFAAPWQVAIVVDPHHHDEGLFMWAGGELPLVAKAQVDPRWGAVGGAPAHSAPTEVEVPTRPSADVSLPLNASPLPEADGAVGRPSARQTAASRPAGRSAAHREADRRARAARRETLPPRSPDRTERDAGPEFISHLVARVIAVGAVVAAAAALALVVFGR